MRLLIAVIVWIAAAAGAAEVSSVVAAKVRKERATGSGSSSFDASSVKAADSQSLFHTANLEHALATVRGHIGANAQLNSFVIYPGYLSLTEVRPAGEVEVYINAANRYSSTNTGGNPGSTPLFKLGKVNAGVPASLVQRIAKAGHVPESQLNYMVAQVDIIDHEFRWLIYPIRPNRVEYFQASGARLRLSEYLTNGSGLKRLRG
jgi:hypothetical protein